MDDYLKGLSDVVNSTNMNNSLRKGLLIQSLNLYLSNECDKFNPNNNYIGVLIYKIDGKVLNEEIKLKNNNHVKSGCVYIKNAALFANDQNKTMHRKCLEMLFGEDIQRNIVSSGFAYKADEKRWHANSGTCNTYFAVAFLRYFFNSNPNAPNRYFSLIEKDHLRQLELSEEHALTKIITQKYMKMDDFTQMSIFANTQFNYVFFPNNDHRLCLQNLINTYLPNAKSDQIEAIYKLFDFPALCKLMKYMVSNSEINEDILECIVKPIEEILTNEENEKSLDELFNLFKRVDASDTNVLSKLLSNPVSSKIIEILKEEVAYIYIKASCLN